MILSGLDLNQLHMEAILHNEVQFAVHLGIKEMQV